jgi:hypothetical protein
VLVFLANELGPGAARMLIEPLPAPPWPSAMITPAIGLAKANGRTDVADRLADYGAREYPTNPLIVALAVRQKYAAGQHRAALATRASATEREDLNRTADTLRCQP